MRRAAVGKRGDQFLGLACLARLQVPAGGSGIDQAPQGGPRKMGDERAGFAQGGEHVVEIVQRGGDPCLLEPEQDLVDAGTRVGLKDLFQAPQRRGRVRELVAVDENSGQRKMGVTRARVGVEAERASRLESSRSLTFGFAEPAVPQRDARGQRRREHKRRDLVARVAGPQGRVGLIGLIDQQVAADQVHPRAGADGPEVQARLDRLDRPPAGVDLIARPCGDRERHKPEHVEGRDVLRPWLRLVIDAHPCALEPRVALSQLTGQSEHHGVGEHPGRLIRSPALAGTG